MSRDARFDQLEAEIVEALRRAPGVEPSRDMDARIRARAHAAVATTARRSQPRWFAVAAGLMVLVGSGLALRIVQQVERAPGPLGEPMQSVPAPAATEPQERAAATEAIAEAKEVAADGDSAQAQAPAPVLVPENSMVTADAPAPERAADKVLAEPVAELAAPPPKVISAPASPPAIATESARAMREPAKPFPATSDARSGPLAPQEPPVTVAPMAAPEMAPAPAPPPPLPSAASDDGYAREDAARLNAAPERLREEAKTRSEPFQSRDREAQPGADSQLQDAEGRAGPTELDQGAAAGALAPPRATTSIETAPGLAPQADAAAREFESIDTATAARRAAAFELRVEAIRKALERGERREARELAAALERDFPESTLPRALRQQLAR